MKVEWVFTRSTSKFGKFYTLPPIYSGKQIMLGSRTELNVKKKTVKLCIFGPYLLCFSDLQINFPM